MKPARRRDDDVFLLTFEDEPRMVSGIEAIRDIGSASQRCTRSSAVNARRYRDRSTGVPKQGAFVGWFGATGEYFSFPYLADGVARAGSGNAITGEFFIGGWVYFPSVLITSNTYYCLSVQDSTPTAAGTAWAIFIANNTIGFAYSDGTTRRTYNRSDVGTPFSTSGWHYVAAERFNNRIFLSVDGTIVMEFTANQTLNVPSGAVIRVNTPVFGGSTTLGNTYHDLWQIKRRAVFRGNHFTPPARAPIGRGPITWTAPVDPYFASTTLLVPCSGTNGSSSFADVSGSPATLTNVGTPTVSTAQDPYGDGLGSLSLDGSTDAIDTNLSPGITTGGFTIEAWIRLTSLPSAFARILNSQSGANPILSLTINPSNQPEIRQRDTTGVTSVNIAGSALSANTWYHVAAVKELTGGVTRLYVDGVQVNSGTANFSISGSPAFDIGYIKSSAAQFFPGFIRDLRWTPGAVRYPSGTTFKPNLSAHLRNA